jgi:hypothetical protein
MQNARADAPPGHPRIQLRRPGAGMSFEDVLETAALTVSVAEICPLTVTVVGLRLQVIWLDDGVQVSVTVPW